MSCATMFIGWVVAFKGRHCAVRWRGEGRLTEFNSQRLPTSLPVQTRSDAASALYFESKGSRNIDQRIAFVRKRW